MKTLNNYLYSLVLIRSKISGCTNENRTYQQLCALFLSSQQLFLNTLLHEIFATRLFRNFDVRILRDTYCAFQYMRFHSSTVKCVFVNQMFGGSSQLPTTAHSVVLKSLSPVQATKQCSGEVGSREDQLNI